MRALLVTSQVTFVPENYATLVCGLAQNPHIVGVLLLQNRTPAVLLQGTMAFLSRRAPGIGKELLKNFFSSFHDLREEAYRKNGKRVFKLKTINCPEALAIVEEEKIDLLVNARTRFIYKSSILNAPRLGCINIHHGILPDQRGVFCDLWALGEGRTAGFSIHKMSARVDDGDILEVVGHTKGFKGRFVDYLYEASHKELTTLECVLDRIAQEGRILGSANAKSPQTRWFKNPGPDDIAKLKAGGLSL